jgi:hypothetical protein
VDDSHVKKIVEFFEFFPVLKGCHRAKEAVCGSTQIPLFFVFDFIDAAPSIRSSAFRVMRNEHLIAASAISLPIWEL